MKHVARLVAVAAALTLIVGTLATPASAKYPFKCDKNTVLVLRHGDATATPETFGTIQAAVDAALGLPPADTDPENPGPSDNAGDTVIVCSGTYFENVNVPVSKSNITIRSFDDGSIPVVVGADGSDPVFDIVAPGVLLGGTHLGFEITGLSDVGIQVGVPGPIDFDQDDDQEQDECEMPPTPGSECPDEELAPFATNNVTIVGNDIKNLGDGTSSVTGIAVNNTNNTLIFRNKIEDLSAGPGATAVGIRYGQTNYNNYVVSNAMKDITQSGGSCTGSLEVPAEGAIGVAIQDEALDAMVDRNKIEEIESSCTAIGVYSNAWGGLENTRNGQQIPIVTTILDNRIKKVESSTAGQSAGIALAPITPANDEDENDPVNSPSSFRVLANDLDDHNEIAVAVLTGLAPNSWIRENDLDHDQIGVLNESETKVDATNNWWGCDEGPDNSKCSSIVNGAGSSASYTPWLKHHASHAGAHAGEYAGH